MAVFQAEMLPLKLLASRKTSPMFLTFEVSQREMSASKLAAPSKRELSVVSALTSQESIGDVKSPHGSTAEQSQFPVASLARHAVTPSRRVGSVVAVVVLLVVGDVVGVELPLVVAVVVGEVVAVVVPWAACVIKRSCAAAPRSATAPSYGGAAEMDGGVSGDAPQ